MPRYDIVLLDADNTLFDFDTAERLALRQTMESQGYPFTTETEDLYLGINRTLWAAFDRGEVTQAFLVTERFRRLIETLGGDHDPVSMNQDYLLALGECSVLLSGAEDFCRTLSRAGCRLALATNGMASVQRARLKNSPLVPLLEAVFISEELGVQKPQRAFFDRAFACLDVSDRSRAIMVGDGLRSDILGGKNAGIDTIWYNPHHLPGDPSMVIPTWTAASYQEVLDRILSAEGNCLGSTGRRSAGNE